jgi:hypothetical protein
MIVNHLANKVDIDELNIFDGLLIKIEFLEMF